MNIRQVVMIMALNGGKINKETSRRKINDGISFCLSLLPNCLKSRNRIPYDHYNEILFSCDCVITLSFCSVIYN